MKKIVVFMLCIIALVLTSTASAEVFSPSGCVRVDASDSGLVTVTGNLDADTAIQFCPDRWKSGCGYNWSVKKKGSSFQLDMRAVKDGQRAFNIKRGTLWLSVPSPRVVVGNNLLLEMSMPSPDSEDGRGGAHFTFVGDVGKQSYKILHPVSQGGGGCGGGDEGRMVDALKRSEDLLQAAEAQAEAEAEAIKYADASVKAAEDILAGRPVSPLPEEQAKKKAHAALRPRKANKCADLETQALDSANIALLAQNKAEALQKEVEKLKSDLDKAKKPAPVPLPAKEKEWWRSWWLIPIILILILLWFLNRRRGIGDPPRQTGVRE